MATAIYPLELPVSLSHPRLGEFCSRFRCQGDPLHVPMADRLMPIENCYWNVLSTVQDHGGELLQGWMIKHWPGLYLAAEHHAVWRCPHGELLDVTQRFPDAGGPTTFAFDSVQTFDAHTSPNVRIEYLPLSRDRRVTQLIELSGKLNSVTIEVNSFLADEVGNFSDTQMAIARGELPEAIQMTTDQLETYKSLVRRGIEIRAEVGAVIDSLLHRPPNQLARAAARQFGDDRRCSA